jgi:PTH1 family peptidyl-tRNA hydrolase
MSPRPQRLLVLSLGNPSEYDGTRHSVGHYVLGKLISRMNAQSVRVGRFQSYVVHKTYEVEQPPIDIWFYRVPGFMNLSGKSVSPFYDLFTKSIGDSNVVVLFDELDVDLGKVKIRKQGSSHRGHNGLRNIQSNSNIGKNYTGVQIGIGRYYDGDKNTPGVVANYVLSKFKNDERQCLDEEVVDKVIDLIDEMCNEGKYIFEKVKN